MIQENPITYSSTGVNYDAMDPFKRNAQQEAKKTSGNLERFGFTEVERSRGESAFVIDEGDRYTAHVVEGLGTKNLVADEVRKIRLQDQSDIAYNTGRITRNTYYDKIAKDNVAMIINDLLTVGADPVVVNAYCAVGSSDWFDDEERSNDLTRGIREAVDEAGAVWGGGETPTLKGIVNPETIDLAGSAYGVIKPKERLTLGDKLKPGDAIILVGSSGIHANGLTLARTLAENISKKDEVSLAEAYATQISDGTMYGEALLEPTHIYASLIRDLFESGIDIHYMANITGHGWRKIMRCEKDLTYNIERIPQPQPIFEFIQQESGNDDYEMYGNYNMGAGFAIFVPREMVEDVLKIGGENHGFDMLHAGQVEEGPRQVNIKPLGLTYGAETLGVR
ncbi:MAG TPA: AIR synthase-related protein [Patescibacteria group bacterium]|nr:AIR synthase-related protein [Patescibacteria group bacterium]